MSTITVRNIPPEIYAKLNQAAEVNRRSISSQIIVCIERTVGSQPIDPDKLLVNARKLCKKTASYTITDNQITHAKNTGRP